MEKANYYKKMARLKYQDKMKKMYLDGMSVRKIQESINKILKRSPSTKNVTLSRGTIHSIIKGVKK